jgi:flagellar hook-associated protein 2
VTSAVSGVTLSLVAAGTTDITVGTDTAAAKANIQSFVDAYNKVITTINSVSKYTEGATTQGPLLSDSMARNLKTSLQTIVGDVSSNTGVFKTLTALGYATDSTTGTLTLKDSSALDSAMSSNYNDVGLLVSDIATSVDSYIDNYLGTTGMISDRTDSLNNQLDDIQSQRDQLDSRISLLRERYTKQFSALDGMIAKMNSTMSYLQQQLANLPG